MWLCGFKLRCGSIPASASPLKGLPAGKACAMAKYKGQVMLSRTMGGRFATAVSMGGLLYHAVDRRSVQRTTILRLLPRRSVSPSCVVLVYLNSSTLVTVSSMRNNRLTAITKHASRDPRNRSIHRAFTCVAGDLYVRARASFDECAGVISRLLWHRFPSYSHRAS